MKFLTITVLIIVLIFCKSCSCKKSTTLPQYNSDFQNSKGTYWKYKVYDSVYNYLDTVTISVGEKTTLESGEEVTRWTITSLFNGSDTNYVSSASDGVKIYSSRSTNALAKRYVFPLFVGNLWITQNIADTNRVTMNSSISVIAGTFSNGFRINRNTKFKPGFNVLIEDEWYVPNIGMVSRYYYEVINSYVKKTKWELISYTIK